MGQISQARIHEKRFANCNDPSGWERLAFKGTPGTPLLFGQRFSRIFQKFFCDHPFENALDLFNTIVEYWPLQAGIPMVRSTSWISYDFDLAASVPVITVQAAVLNGLSQVLGRNIRGVIEVGDGAGDL